jgi:hypothetical protein
MTGVGLAALAVQAPSWGRVGNLGGRRNRPVLPLPLSPSEATRVIFITIDADRTSFTDCDPLTGSIGTRIVEPGLSVKKLFD